MKHPIRIVMDDTVIMAKICGAILFIGVSLEVFRNAAVSAMPFVY